MIKNKKQILSPPGWPLLLAGVSMGLLVGALSWQKYPDDATAVGIAYVLGLTLGAWLGTAVVNGVSLALFGVYRRMTTELEDLRLSLERRFADVRTLFDMDEAADQPVSMRLNSSIVAPRFPFNFYRALLRVSSYLYPFATILAFSQFAVIILLDAGGLEVPSYMFMLMLVSLALFAVSLSMYFLTFARGWRLVRKSEKVIAKLDSLEQLLTAKRNGSIVTINPELSAMERATILPPRLLAPLVA